MWKLGQRMNVSNCILWSMKIYSMHCLYYRCNRTENNVVSTELNHTICLHIAEEINSLCIFVMSHCACEVQGKRTMNMWSQDKVCCTKFGRNHLKFITYFTLTILSNFIHNFKAIQLVNWLTLIIQFLKHYTKYNVTISYRFYFPGLHIGMLQTYSVCTAPISL